MKYQDVDGHSAYVVDEDGRWFVVTAAICAPARCWVKARTVGRAKYKLWTHVLRDIYVCQFTHLRARLSPLSQIPEMTK